MCRNQNYFSVTNAGAEGKVEAIVKKEFLTGNYVATSQKPAIITTFGAVKKSDSDDLQRIHDCSVSKWCGVNSYISIDKQKLETIVSVIKQFLRTVTWPKYISVTHTGQSLFVLLIIMLWVLNGVFLVTLVLLIWWILVYLLEGRVS